MERNDGEEDSTDAARRKGKGFLRRADEFSKDGKGIYVTTDKDSEFHRLAYVSLQTKEHSYLDFENSVGRGNI